VICRINGREISTNEEVEEAIKNSGGGALVLEICRKNVVFETTLTPALSRSDGSWRGGLWVRDSSAGIGTMTFYDPESGLFGGLGHPVCDVDTGDILPLAQGEIVDVEITGVTEGLPGALGQLRGSFLHKEASGVLLSNTQAGVSGQLYRAPAGEAMPIALRQEVKAGRAEILATVEGSTPQRYAVIIEKVNLSDENPTRNLTLRITDETLLRATGGIVQGMSGSPIIQNGKLIGAVTHVLVNDPTRGYGIFIENMLEAAG